MAHATAAYCSPGLVSSLQAGRLAAPSSRVESSSSHGLIHNLGALFRSPYSKDHGILECIFLIFGTPISAI